MCPHRVAYRETMNIHFLHRLLSCDKQLHTHTFQTASISDEQRPVRAPDERTMQPVSMVQGYAVFILVRVATMVWNLRACSRTHSSRTQFFCVSARALRCAMCHVAGWLIGCRSANLNTNSAVFVWIVLLLVAQLLLCSACEQFAVFVSPPRHSHILTTHGTAHTHVPDGNIF